MARYVIKAEHNGATHYLPDLYESATEAVIKIEELEQTLAWAGVKFDWVPA